MDRGLHSPNRPTNLGVFCKYAKSRGGSSGGGNPATYCILYTISNSPFFRGGGGLSYTRSIRGGSSKVHCRLLILQLFWTLLTSCIDHPALEGIETGVEFCSGEGFHRVA